MVDGMEHGDDCEKNNTGTGGCKPNMGLRFLVYFFPFYLLFPFVNAV